MKGMGWEEGREGGKGVAGFIRRAILEFLWNPLSGATPFRKKGHEVWPAVRKRQEGGEGGTVRRSSLWARRSVVGVSGARERHERLGSLPKAGGRKKDGGVWQESDWEKVWRVWELGARWRVEGEGLFF